MKKWHLFLKELPVIIKVRLPFRAIAEKARADAFPKAGPHGERIACWLEVLAIETVVELMEVLMRVVRKAEPQAAIFPFLYNLPHTVRLYSDAFWRDTYATEEPSRAEQPGKTGAIGLNKYGTLALIAHHLLSEHIAAGFQAVGWLGMNGEPALAL